MGCIAVKKKGLKKQRKEPVREKKDEYGQSLKYTG